MSLVSPLGRVSAADWVDAPRRLILLVAVRPALASRIVCRLWNMRGALVGSLGRLLLVFRAVLVIPGAKGLAAALS